jgi:hypothetical protein
LDLHLPLKTAPPKESIADVPLKIRTKDNAATSLYIESVSNKIVGVFNSWPSANSKAHAPEGVSIVITIASDGSLVDAFSPNILVTENQSKLINKSIKAITYAAPFSPPPKEVIQTYKSVQFSRSFAIVR